MIAISTTWNYSENCDLKSMFLGIKALGLDCVELGYNFTASRINEAIALARDFGIKFVSVHNFCPLPPQNEFRRFFTNYYYLSSLNTAERKNAVSYTKKTIDTAVKVGAKIIIIHAGAIEMDNKYTKQLIDFYNAGKIQTEEAKALREELLEARRQVRDPYIDATMKSLEELLAYAKDMGIKVGLENRYYPNEIPNNIEADLFLKEFNDKGLVYWHDAGHSEAQERMGIIGANSLLESLGGYLAGFHLHNLNGLRDHRAPLEGDFDLNRLASYLLRGDLLKVIEAHQPAGAEQIKEALRCFRLKNWL